MGSCETDCSCLSDVQLVVVEEYEAARWPVEKSGNVLENPAVWFYKAELMGQERGVEHSAKAPQRRHLIPMQSVRVAQAGDFHLLPHCTNQLCGPLEQPLRPGLEQLRVVTAAADEPKVAMLRGLSLKPVEQWWVKPVDPSGTTAASGRVEGSGFSGIVGPAPPVYDPGLAAFMADAQVPWGLEALAGEITEPAWRTKPTWYLIATEDRAIAPDAQRFMASRAKATLVEAAGSHVIYLFATRSSRSSYRDR